MNKSSFIFFQFNKCVQNVIWKKDLYFLSSKRNLHLSKNLEQQKTALYDFHVNNDGKMVEFANYLMPVQFGKVGIAASHKHVRSQCGLFDVSHMLQTKIYGKDRVKFIESLIVADIEGLKNNTGTLSLFTNENGGIIDDLICSKVNNNQEYLYVVSNAGCREKDLKHMENNIKKFKSMKKDVDIEVLEDYGLVALQGPKASSVLKKISNYDLDKLYFMNTIEIELLGVTCRVTRCGYTGEDGFEISVPNEKITELCQNLLGSSDGVVQLAGLGARDSLRLEAGLCLYGNDIDEQTTPIEAMLAWTIGKRRRESADFPGAEIILRQLKEKPSRKRIGLISEGPPPRSACQVLSKNNSVIGEVTSGCPSPSLGKNIAMAYVPSNFSKPGTELFVKVRNKVVPATVTKMPFVKCNYHS
ncbi:Aminomethyltransferase, mitochondrial [Armadillidium nasatum]|uniref:Aminomethyltransferase n=1 Tax=Armadillidium nasatum TaxID=96803 RepID=A0A5N5SUI4_9CRUS|nr:Aminomethyltransferase, mitochondrial [Armadillidium nasatum]